MTSLMGICTHSMATVAENLRANKINTAVLTADFKKLKNLAFLKKLDQADVILASGVKACNNALSILNRMSPSIIVFDNPALLAQYAGMQVLDIKPSANLLQYNFSNIPLDYKIICKAIKDKKRPRQPLERNTKDLLDDVLKIYTVSGLLDKFNTFIYATTTPLHRSAVKTIVVQFIFGKINDIELKKQLSKYIKFTPKSTDLLNPIIEYVVSQPGQQLQKALKHAQQMENQASRDSRRPIAYKKLAELYGVDQFELRNIILWYRGSGK